MLFAAISHKWRWKHCCKRYERLIFINATHCFKKSIRERSNIIWRFFGGRGGFWNRQNAVIWERRDLAKSLYDFYSSWKSL